MEFFKKKQAVFGDTIEPNCRYCRYNSAEAEEEAVKCPNHTEEKESCRRYEYDPTRRIPKRAPKLGAYTQDDFSL